MTRAQREREAWILARKAEGMWIEVCQSCGSMFAQPRMGRRGTLCNRRICILAYRWQRKYGRMPPDWLWLKWRHIHGDAERTRPSSSLRYEDATEVSA